MKPLSWPIVTLTLAVVIALWPLFLGRFYAVSDMRDVFIPLELFFHQQELQAHLSAWNPNAAFGFPVIAAAQIGFFYPPLLLLRLLPIQVYLPAAVIANFWLLALGWYVFLRGQKLSRMAAIFGTLSFSFSAFIWEHLTHLNVFLALAWLPWQFLVANKLSQAPRWKLRQIAALAMIIGVPFLIGQLQIQTFSTLVIFAYIAFLRGREQYVQTIRLLIIASVIAFAIASAQLLPTYELVKFSSRGATGSFNIQTANQYSFPLYHAPTFIFPRFYGSDDTYWGKHLEIEYGVFIGTLPLLIALATIVKTKPWQHTHGRFFFWLLVVSFLLALGSLSPFRLLKIEPTLWIFSAPARWLLFTTLALTYFAAWGFDHVLLTLSKKYWLWSLGILGIPVALWNIFIFSRFNISSVATHVLPHAAPEKVNFVTAKITSLLHSAQGSSVSLTSWWTYLPFISLLVAFLSFDKKYYVRAILGVTAIELILVATTTVPTVPWTEVLSVPSTYASLPPAVRTGQARLYSIRNGGDTGAYFTDPSSRANAAIRAQQKNILVPLVNAQFNIPGVEWPASLDIQAVSNALATLRGDSGYDIKNPATVSQLNIGAVLMPDNLPAIVPGTLLTTQAGINIFATPSQPRAQLTTMNGQQVDIPYISLSPTQIMFTTSQAGRLLVRDTWYPGWQATIDNVSIPITQTPPFFRSLNIPAGKHTVLMTYHPTLIYWGMGLSVLAILLCSATLVLKSIKPIV